MKRMPVLADYQIMDIEIETKSYILYKGYSVQDNTFTLLKTLKQPNPTPKEIASCIHEFHITKELDMDAIIQPIKLEKHLNQPFLVMEYFTGVTLKDYIRIKKLDMVEFLSIAIKLSDALLHLYDHQIIHKNINPENILFEPHSGQLKIIGFHFATKLQKESQRNNISPYELEGQLAYISPEQTGRMNRSVDCRADLYSLGIVLYELITGVLPFTSQDPMELLHAHLAKTPLTPSEISEAIPVTISNIIMKLLSKIPENRYKSAYGLREDLKMCMEQLRMLNQVEDFSLGQNDPIVIFEVGSRLYGRKVEIGKLHSSFERVSAGKSELVLIQGQSGIGKTALVNEIQTPLVREKGYFISGKFDLLQRQKPYSPLIQAFKSLIKQVLTEGKESIAEWKSKIETELAGNTAIISSIIPELVWILGSNVENGELVQGDVHLRFHLIFQKFVSIFAKKEHPLVIFLDDLQWADTASLELIEYLMTHVDCRYLLLIGAYRDNEVGVEHPFTYTISNLEENQVMISNITLHPLEEDVIYHWVEEIMMDNGIEIKKLAELVFRVTQGNPFFVRQLLQSFYHDETLYFRSDLGRWSYHVDRLRKAMSTESIIDLMGTRVQQLPENTQYVLKMASCFGSEFDLKTLSTICEEDYEFTSRSLWLALEAGLILPEDSLYKWIYPEGPKQLVEDQPPIYRFLHDKVQQAVYMLMNKEEQEKAHLKIGRFLIKHGTVVQNVFEIVNHLNVCREFLNETEWFQLVEWNIRAGEQAKDSAAFKESLTYFQTAYEMLGAGWQTHYELTNRLMTGLGECLYLNSDFEEAEAIFDQVLFHVRTSREKLSIYNLKVVLYTHVHRVEEAVESGLVALRLFGWNIHRNPSKVLIAKELLLVKLALSGKTPEQLKQLPILEDEEKRLLLNTMITMNAPSFHVDQNLATILMLRAVRFSLKHGITDLTALVFNNYAVILSAGFQDFMQSYKFGKLAMELAEKSGNVGIKGRVNFVFGTFINHWKHPINQNLNYLKESQQYCIDVGNIHVAGASSSFIAITLLMRGDHLQEVLHGVHDQIQFIDQIRYPISKGFLQELIHWINVLMEGEDNTNWEFEHVLEDDSAKIMHYTVRLQLSYLFHNEPFAKLVRQQLDQLINDRLTLVVISEFYFYDALWAARLYSAASIADRKLLHKRLNRNVKKLEKWAKLSPSNYLHKWNLLKAEIARIEENHPSAITFYDTAIKLAADHNFIQDVAISNEVAGSYYLSRGLESLGSAYLTEAYRSYHKWGAYAKANILKEEYESFIITEHFIPIYPDASQFDIDSSLKAAQTLAGEIMEERLMKKLMTITMEYSGAEQGILLLNREEQLVVAAKANVDGEFGEILSFQPFEEATSLSQMIVNYVMKTKEAVVLNHATNDGIFVEDPYIKQYKPKSILCLPAIHKGRINSILYLENNQSTYAFTQERIKFLSFLATQAAISIENAELYSKLEEKVKERTVELEQVNQHLQQMNVKLATSEQERRHLLSNISHDLRSPIASAIGYMDAILDGLVENKEQMEEYLRKSIGRLHGLNMLINDLFELAQYESGKINFNYDIVPIDQVMKQISEQFVYDVTNKGLSFDILMDDVGEEYPLVHMDIKRFSQVFENIISNAINHTSKGGITISLSFSANLEDAFISIQDTGEGIVEEDLPYIFDRYYTKSRQGNGLGLAISREIILSHKGKIWAESEPNKGSTFYIQLPVFQVNHAFA